MTNKEKPGKLLKDVKPKSVVKFTLDTKIKDIAGLYRFKGDKIIDVDYRPEFLGDDIDYELTIEELAVQWKQDPQDLLEYVQRRASNEIIHSALRIQYQ